MKEITDFKPGTKFKYLGNRFKNEYDRTQEVIHILTIDGKPSVRSKFLDNGFINIFEVRNNRTSYSFHCHPINTKLDNGIPMFWDEQIDI
jgi:hypothetical protein